jgi:hypothetical protein
MECGLVKLLDEPFGGLQRIHRRGEAGKKELKQLGDNNE